MYEAAVKDALYTLISSNTAALVAGITQQGSARTIQLVKELIVEIKHPYYLSISVANMRTWEDTGISVQIVQSGTMRAEYDVELELFEYARDLVGGVHGYEVAGKDFDLLVARLVKLLKEQQSFTSSIHGTHTFELHRSADARLNRRIDVEITDYPGAVTNGVPVFYAKLSLTLDEECVSLAGAA